MNKITVKKKTDNFTIIDNTGLRDKTLSWKAKGLLAYLLHLPDDWEIYLSDLKNRSRDGRDSTAAGIKELEEKRYITKGPIRNKKGLFLGYDYTVSETPICGLSVSGLSDTVKPFPGNPTSAKPTLLSTNKLSTNNTKVLKNKDTTETQNTFDKFWNIYNKKVGKEKAYNAFTKIKKDDYELIFKHLPNYVEATPDKAFRKHPTTYLNNKCWNDEIIKNVENKGFYKAEEERVKALLKERQQRKEAANESK